MIQKQHQSQKRNYTAVLLSLSVCLLGLKGEVTDAVQPKDIDLEVGVVQRFGENLSDELILKASPGDVLTLRFLAGDMQPMTLKTNEVKIKTIMQPLSQPRVFEHLVLSSHATFETAEDSAKRFAAEGIQVEITQPERWQVWAKRDVYQTPLLRRLLLDDLEARGNSTAYLKTDVVEAVPRISFVANGFRYTRRHLEVTTQKNQVQVTSGDTTRLYGGSVKVQPNAYETYTLVNTVPLETYLRGVVPHEIGTGAPDEAIKAQTIIARTYALRNLRRFKADKYELCADTHCQVYRGLTDTYGRADQAISATTGEVLTYEDELVDALYSSTTGGVTASFNDIWNGEERPYLKAVIDSPQNLWDLSQKSLADETAFRNFLDLEKGFNETGTVAFRWNRGSNMEDLSKDLQKYLKNRKHPLAHFEKIVKMEIVERSPSGRIQKMIVETDQGNVELEKTEVRSAFMPPRSTFFYLDPILGTNATLKGYNFVGGGFGHGVGMSQYGSYNLANLGWSAQRILEFYYPATEIKILDDSILFFKED